MPVTTNECSTPECGGEPVEGKRICQECVDRLAEIRDDFEKNPKLIFMQRSDQRRKTAQAQGKTYRSVPTCSRTGCFDPRMPGEPFCGGSYCYDE